MYCLNFAWVDILVEDLLRDFEHEVQGPYLLYRNTSQEVNGIWFYNERAYEEVARLFDGYIYTHHVETDFCDWIIAKIKLAP